MDKMRIATSKQTAPFWTVLALVVLLELGLFFVIGVIKRPGESWVWIGSFAVIAFTFIIYRKYTHARRDWDRIACLELMDGKIALVPDASMRSIGYTRAEAAFSPGARLEWHINTGDAYFTGDHGIELGTTLWVVQPTGKKHQLLDNAGYLNLKITARNLQETGIELRVVKYYDGQEGEHTEADVTAENLRASSRMGKTSPIAVLIGTSSLWLGALAGIFINKPGFLVAIGLFGYAVLAILTLCSKTSKRSALIQLATAIPTYGAGYALAVVITRNLAHR